MGGTTVTGEAYGFSPRLTVQDSALFQVWKNGICHGQ